MSFFAPRLPKSTTAKAPTSGTSLVIKESVDFRGELKQKTNVSHWVHGHFKVHDLQQNTANCNHCKTDYFWKSSTSTLVSHLRSKHRDIYDAEEKKEAAYKVDVTERQHTKQNYSFTPPAKQTGRCQSSDTSLLQDVRKLRTSITHYLLRDFFFLR